MPQAPHAVNKIFIWNDATLDAFCIVYKYSDLMASVLFNVNVNDDKVKRRENERERDREGGRHTQTHAEKQDSDSYLQG